MNTRYTIKGIPNDLLTNEIINDRRLKTDGTPKDFSIEVALGNVPGFSTTAVVTMNPSASNTDFFDVWSGGTVAGATLNMTLPITAEAWTIESTSALDTNSSGTGARTVIVQSLDINYNINTAQVVELDGTNAVDLTGTHYRTHQLAATSGMLVLTSGSIANPDGGVIRKNQGTLIIRDKASGNVRMTIQPLAGKSEDGHIAIPAGRTLILLQDINPWDKDQSGTINIEITPSTADASTISTGSFPGYQNDLTIVFQAKFQFTEKTDVILVAKPLNDGAKVRFVYEFYVLDNAIVGI